MARAAVHNCVTARYLPFLTYEVLRRLTSYYSVPAYFVPYLAIQFDRMLGASSICSHTPALPFGRRRLCVRPCACRIRLISTLKAIRPVPDSRGRLTYEQAREKPHRHDMHMHAAHLLAV